MFASTFDSKVLITFCFIILLPVVSANADVCPNCLGTGRMIKNFENVKCRRCNGSGTVDQGGIPDRLPETGYQTNKFELKKKVEDGGWKVAWAEDVTETDAAEGVVAAGVSVAGANPAPFIEWLEALVNRTVDTLEVDADRVGQELKAEIANVVTETIRSAIQGQSGKEIARRLGQIDVKGGAIRYSGRNYVGNQTVSRTWGMKPYIALRWRRAGDTNEPKVTPGIGSVPGNQGTNPNADDPLLNNATKTYEITLHTGSQFGAGTDADVFVTVIGSLGIKQAIPLEKPGNDRERGDVDTYQFQCRNLGQINSINIWHDNSGIGPGWFLGKVELRDVTDNVEWFFECNNWLAVDEGDRRIGRTLTVKGQVR